MKRARLKSQGGNDGRVVAENLSHPADRSVGVLAPDDSTTGTGYGKARRGQPQGRQTRRDGEFFRASRA
jgi:hypothetical protein